MSTRGSRYLTVLGFSSVLALLAVIVIFSLNQMSAVNQRIETTIQQQRTKIELIGTIRSILRERALWLHRLALVPVASQRQAQWAAFQQSAGHFNRVRGQLVAMASGEEEQQTLGQWLQQTAASFQRQNQAAKAIRTRRDVASQLLLADAAVAQHRQMAEFDKLLQLEYALPDTAVSTLDSSYAIAYRWMLGVGAITLLLGVGIAFFVTRRTARVEAALFRQREHAEVTLHSIADAVITTDTDGRIDQMNHMAEKLTGWRAADAHGQLLGAVFRIVNEITHQPVDHPVYDLVPDGQTVALDSDHLLLNATGREFSIEDSVAPIRNYGGETVGLVLVFRDVTETRSLARQLAWQARHDMLTGLVNRHEFETRLNTKLESIRLNGGVYALLYLGLDQFKVVNDTCGHAAGDELLRQLTTLLQECLPPSVILARLGGDEFGALLPHCSLAMAEDAADKLLGAVQQFHFVWEDKTFFVGASIGVVDIGGGRGHFTSLLGAADSACHIAKRKGRNRIQVFRADDVELARLHDEMTWVSGIAKAFEEDRFRLYYQRISPIGESRSNQGIHYEILLRMEGEDGVIIAPGAFIPAAERYNLMPTLDRWVIRKTFGLYQSFASSASARPQNVRSSRGRKKSKNSANRNAAVLPRDTLAINLSGASLMDDYFLEFVRDQLALHHIPPGVICFEITETAAIANLQAAGDFILALRQHGCRFALDDFGSGMSSFSYLKNLAVDYLKIDGAFVRDMVNDSIDCSMVEAINRVGHVMGIETIAEFVESNAILDKLDMIGVDYAQGYAVHRPEPFIQ